MAGQGPKGDNDASAPGLSRALIDRNRGVLGRRNRLSAPLSGQRAVVDFDGRLASELDVPPAVEFA